MCIQALLKTTLHFSLNCLQVAMLTCAIVGCGSNPVVLPSDSDIVQAKQQLLENAYVLAANAEVAGDYEAANQRWTELQAVAPDYEDVA